jgi:nucleoside-diphosphate-sugar epimerase
MHYVPRILVAGVAGFIGATSRHQDCPGQAGWEPTVTLDDGLKPTIDYFEEEIQARG